MTENDTDKEAARQQAVFKLMDQLAAHQPKYGPCPPEVRDWWENTALPTLRDHALSALRRKNQFPPTIVCFSKEAPSKLLAVDIGRASGGNWGDPRSKDITAIVHRTMALIPDTLAAVFCCEAWGLRANAEGKLDRQYDKYPILGDHPDAYEIMMFTMLSYEPKTDTMAQLSTMTEVIKVLGKNTSPSAWLDTKFGKSTTTDPLSDSGLKLGGRFVPSNPSLDGVHDEPTDDGTKS